MVLSVATDLIEAPATPAKLQETVRPTTPSTSPGTPSHGALSSRVNVLKELVEKAPKPNLSLVWPQGCQPEMTTSFPDEGLWQEILVRFGACGVPATRDVEHFEKIIKAGMDANAVPFPCMEQQTGVRKVLPWPRDASEVSLPYQDQIAFPFLPRISIADAQCKSDADADAFDMMLCGRAKAPHDLRESFYMMPPLDTELSPWPSLEDSVVAADTCTEAQLRVWKLREERPILPERVERRRAILSKKLGHKFNSCVLEELRPTLSREAALLELKAARAKDKAEEAKQYDELAEKGATSVAWVVPNTRQWPVQPSAWKQHCRWFAMWRAQPALPSSFAFKPLKRSASDSSISSWAAVSDVSWMEVESKALECGWQEVLDEQMPVLAAACNATMHLDKKDIVELRCLANPPAGVKLTMEVVCILLQESPAKLRNGGLDYWTTSKDVMNSMDFLGRLHALNDYVPARVLEAVAPYMCRDDFTPENIKRQSFACSGLCLWARELYKYHLLGQASAEAARREFAAKPAAELLATSQEAAQGLSKLSKNHFSELKVLGKPPAGIDVVVSCLLHLFAGVDAEMEWIPSKDRSWKTCQKLLADPSKMLDRILKFPDAILAGEVPRRNIEKVRRIQLNMGRAFSADAMMKKSVAVAGICSWLLNIVAFYDRAAPVRHEEVAPVRHEERVKIVAAEKDPGLQDVAFPVDKAAITELKSMTSPPQSVMVVCVCVCILRPLGTEDMNAGWAGAKAMLSDPSLLKALQHFKVENVQEEQMTRVRELMGTEKQAFDIASLQQVSTAACVLLRWVHAVVEQYEATGQSKKE